MRNDDSSDNINITSFDDAALDPEIREMLAGLSEDNARAVREALAEPDGDMDVEFDGDGDEDEDEIGGVA